tara:strand:+ start:622 stop:888 length:267 start_codon:yes stop_codon:yes gene_type:complete
MTDNNTFYGDFDWDADTEEMEPREFRKAYEESDSLFPQVRLEPEITAEESTTCSRIAVPNKKFHGRLSIMLKHFMKFFSDTFSRNRFF